MTGPEPGPPGQLDPKALSGFPWTLATFAMVRGTTVLTTIVMARLLVPKDFGLFALAAVAIGALTLFSDLGLGGVVVVRPNLDRLQLGTAFSLMAGMGLLVAGTLAAAAPLVANLLEEARLTSVLIALAAASLLNVPALFYGAVLQREMEFARLFVVQVVGVLAYAAVGIAMAAADSGVWSLVGGQAASFAAQAIAAVIVSPTRVRPAFHGPTASDLTREGRGFVAQSLLAYAETHVDRLAVGRMLGAAQLGLYSMAFRMAELPFRAIAEPVARVTFPGFAQIHSRGESVAGAFVSTMRPVTAAGFGVGVVISASAEPFTLAVFGSEWAGMAGPLAVLAIWGALSHLESSFGYLLTSIGRVGVHARISAFGLAALAPAVAISAAFGNLVTVAVALLGHQAGSTAARSIAACRAVGMTQRQVWDAIRPSTLASVVAWPVAYVTSLGASSLPAGVWSGITATSGLLSYGVVLHLLDRSLMVQMRQLVSGIRSSAR